jgi:GT2 family glycosyltransferase
VRRRPLRPSGARGDGVIGSDAGTGSRPSGGSVPARVSVIVVSWRSETFLPGCLDSLAAQTHPPAEVLVVDNGSDDGSIELVRTRYPWVRLLPLRENTGFCRANNIGLAEARGDAVLFLNADAALDPPYLETALAAFARDARIGAVAGRIFRFDGATIDTAGQCLARSRRVVERGYGRPDDRRLDQAGYVFSVCGAAALYRREAIEDILEDGSLFDEDFFAFSEDIDLGWRARNAGWRAYYEPRAVGRHHRGGSGAQPTRLSSRAAILRRGPELRYHVLKNRYLTLLKNDRALDVLRDLPFILPRDAALLALAVASGPGVLARLARSGPLFSRALEKRRRFLSKRGVWGRRAAGLPNRWAGDTLLPDEPPEGAPGPAGGASAERSEAPRAGVRGGDA